MSYNKVDSRDVEPIGDGLRFLRDPLGCEKLGVTILDADPGWTGKEHDHGEDGQEEVYVLLDGSATVTVEGEDVQLESGEALRIPAEATRQIHNGDTESKFVLVGASGEE
ncbi:cupin domain-containing protein [Halorussus gelatinilyticus]|uniref:Cupin domain-containing protein n=1 Tax=Halorussus gelatinilyticus TaxID=2937524 RepID=A0A8U0IDH6_9EURY|nr:cupin domain-containing protein [Halorussus gelatinilyticus]UPV98765.1 cupin domain-containing protein [Halorussus gelatinilyticus]